MYLPIYYANRIVTIENSREFTYPFKSRHNSCETDFADFETATKQQWSMIVNKLVNPDF